MRKHLCAYAMPHSRFPVCLLVQDSHPPLDVRQTCLVPPSPSASLRLVWTPNPADAGKVQPVCERSKKGFRRRGTVIWFSFCQLALFEAEVRRQCTAEQKRRSRLSFDTQTPVDRGSAHGSFSRLARLSLVVARLTHTSFLLLSRQDLCGTAWHWTDSYLKLQPWLLCIMNGHNNWAATRQSLDQLCNDRSIQDDRSPSFGR